MKIAIFGGSFNPIHIGHVELAKNAIKALKLDKLFFIPAFISPFKQDSVATDMGISDENRLKMLELAIQESGQKKLFIDNCEILRGGVSYTVDTVEYINKKYNTKTYLIIGDDLVKDFEKWKEPKKLAEISNIVLARRNFQQEINFDYAHINIKNPIVLSASSQVRTLLTEGKDAKEYLCKSVYNYIKENNLYGYWQGLISRFDAILEHKVSENRYNHSIRVAKMLKKLCLHYGLDQNKGFFTGLTHDLCKNLTDDELIMYAKKNNLKISKIEKENPSLLHGAVASIVLKKEYGILDEDILEAIKYHTFGKKKLNPLGMLLFVADKIEEGRPQVNEEYYKRLFSLSLNDITLSVLEENIEYLQNRGKKVSKLSFEMQKALQKNKG